VSVAALICFITNQTAYHDSTLTGELVGKGSNMEATAGTLPQPFPHPVQAELLPVSGQTAFDEYRAAFHNESAHMPEVSLRYFIALILTDAPEAEIRKFACLCRTELNEQRLQIFLKQVAS
jgi:hypothetical protein